MAIMMVMRWNGVTAEQYDEVRELVGWERDPAPGGLFHAAAADEHGLHVTDLWDSVEQFQAFVTERLMPGVAQIGITTQPDVEVAPLHALFAPGWTRA